jgi:hypothetical protein
MSAEELIVNAGQESVHHAITAASVLDPLRAGTSPRRCATHSPRVLRDAAAGDHSRYALCATASFVTLSDGDQAEIEATAALRLFGEVPEQSRWTAGELSMRTDLAAARILRGDLAGAQDALVSVFALDVERRTESLTRRLTSLGRMLGSARYRDAIEAGRIGDAIEDFTTRSLPRNAIRAIINPTG